MSRILSLAAVLLLAVAVSPSPLLIGADDAKPDSRRARDPGTTTHPADDEGEGPTARRVRLDRIVEDSIQQKLLKRVTLKIHERTLEDALSEVSKEHDLPVAIDRATLSDEGVALDQTLSLDVEDITLRSALRLILQQFQLDTIIRDEILTVTTSVRAGESLENRIYDVDSLLRKDDFTELIEVITSCVEPDQWDEVGGPCSVRELDTTRSLGIRATERVHELVASLLTDLNSMIHPDEVKLAANPIRERELAVRQKLVEICSIDSDGPLEQVLSRFAADNKLPLWTDRATLVDEGIAYDQAVIAHLKDVRVESALNHLLRPLDMTWIVEDEVLKVTSRVNAGEHLVTHVYDVRDFARKIEPTWPPRQDHSGPGAGAVGMGGGHFSIRSEILKQGFGAGGQDPPRGVGGAMPEPRWLVSGYDLTEPIEFLTSTIEPDTWDEVGGPGSVRGFEHALVIRQTAEVHSRIEVLIHKLRKAHRRRAELAAAKAQDPQKLERVVYEFVEPYAYSPEDLAKLIPESIAPETWKKAGGKATLVAQPTSLVITQTPAVHKEIVKLLFEVVLRQRIE